MKIEGNTMLVTGGGSGIGEALARRFHDRGNTVIVTGRRRDALEKAAAGRANMVAMPLDVADPEAVEAFARRVVEEHPGLNVLFNNAGVMRFEALDRTRDLADAEAMVKTNLLGPIRMTNALMAHLASRPDAAIINNTSALAFVPLVAAPTYSATKAAMHSYTVALRNALGGKVEVIELAPPAVQTDIMKGQESPAGNQPLDEFADEVMALLGQRPTPPEIVVERAGFLRFAEREGRFAETLKQINTGR